MRKPCTGRFRGQALVEFALILPVLLVIIMGILEFGRAWNMKQVLTDASREGARVAVVADPTLTTYDAARTAVLRHVDSMLWRAGMDTTLDRVTFPDSLKNGTGMTVSVRIAYPFRFLVLQRLAKIMQLDSLRTATRMRNE